MRSAIVSVLTTTMLTFIVAPAAVIVVID